MFRIVTANGLNIIFSAHANGNYRAVAKRDGESFELSRSIRPADLAYVINSIVSAQTDEENFRRLCRKIKAGMKKRSG